MIKWNDQLYMKTVKIHLENISGKYNTSMKKDKPKHNCLKMWW